MPILYPLNELNHIEALYKTGQPYLRRKTLTTIHFDGYDLPLDSFSLGSENRASPVLAFVGGIHGLERIGSEIILAFMESLIERLQWDVSLIDGLGNLRLLFIPAVNPVGMLRQTRANGNHVDLMRNAPVEAEGKVPFLVGGHRFTSRLPWYRGKDGDEMQLEAAVVCEEIKSQLFVAPYSLVLDCHSGFGFQDRLWFHYAFKREPLENLAEVYALFKVMNKTYPHLTYHFEPQTHHYSTHGDLWDYLYQQSLDYGTTFLPLTLEMGSWRWVRKNPMQVFSALGLFHPIKPHRVQRTLHTIFMEFLIRAVRAYNTWNPTAESRDQYTEAELKHWYE